MSPSPLPRRKMLMPFAASAAVVPVAATAPPPVLPLRFGDDAAARPPVPPRDPRAPAP